MSDEKPTFYTFDGSAWAGAPRLAIAELGYDLEKDFNVKTLSLLDGENFNPSYLKVQPTGTVPALVDLQGEVLDSTVKVVKYLVANAPRKPESWEPATPEIVEAFHASDIDPNDASVGYSPDDATRKAKANDIPGKYWTGRKAALEKYAASAPAELKQFYDDKIKYNQHFVDIYSGKASDDELAEYYKKSAELWKAIGSFLSGTFAKSLADKPASGAFYSGEKPGEADFHAAAWLARVVTGSGGSLDSLAKATGGVIPDAVEAYWKAWAQRESFRKLGIA